MATFYGDCCQAGTYTIVFSCVYFDSARFAYEKCVHTSALLKCNKESAIFLQKVAKLLSSETNFLSCDRIDHERCSAERKVTANKMLLMVVLLLVLETISHP